MTYFSKMEITLHFYIPFLKNIFWQTFLVIILIVLFTDCGSSMLFFYDANFLLPSRSAKFGSEASQPGHRITFPHHILQRKWARTWRLPERRYCFIYKTRNMLWEIMNKVAPRSNRSEIKGNPLTTDNEAIHFSSRVRTVGHWAKAV